MSLSLLMSGRKRGKLSAGAQPDLVFTLSSSELSLTQGSTVSHTLTLTRNNGYTADVNISCWPLPTGVTFSFSDSVLSGADTLCVITYTASSTAPLITATPVVVLVSSLTASAYTTIDMTVVPKTSSSISIGVASQMVNVAAEHSISVPITVTRNGGFTGTITLSASLSSGSPVTVTCTPSTLADGETTSSLVITSAGTTNLFTAKALTVIAVASGTPDASQAINLFHTTPFALNTTRNVFVQGTDLAVRYRIMTHLYREDSVLNITGLPAGVTIISVTERNVPYQYHEYTVVFSTAIDAALTTGTIDATITPIDGLLSSRTASFPYSMVAPTASGSPYFTDTFDGIQKNNSNGVQWGNTSAGVSMVRFDDRDCIRFRFGPSGNTQEQYYDMGRYSNAVWVEYSLHVPSNFSMAASGFNNKFWTMWRDIYSDFYYGTQGVLNEYTNATGAITPIGRLRTLRRRTESATQVLMQYIVDIIGDATNGTQFIGGTGPVILGSWNTIRYAVKGSSAYGVCDGYYKLWVNGTLVINLVNQPMYNMFPTPSDVKFRWAYILGAANAYFTVDTDFHVDYLHLYETDPGW